MKIHHMNCKAEGDLVLNDPLVKMSRHTHRTEGSQYRSSGAQTASMSVRLGCGLPTGTDAAKP